MTAKQIPREITPAEQVVEALSFPFRLEILRILCYRTASPVSISKELGETLNKVNFHIKVLRKTGCIELVREKQKRGATEHIYRATCAPEFDDEEWARLSQTQREAISAIVLRGAIGEVLRATQQGTFDSRTNRHASWLPMDVDEQGWTELTHTHLETLEKCQRIRAESAERLLSGGQKGQRAVAVALSFLTPAGFGLDLPA